ncbi:hypothetical protein NQ317_019511 [Molorchus minor]|uniref:RCC1 domain-containing protein 1 n=1 Tax=Molorchus minor TaxID=1323400 RepID=A0ABQ9JWN2_9CUCU|nr:hypothetical protein NQ317_019511 [Molorchus minor]
MRVLSKGFNLYGQLDLLVPLIENFTHIFLTREVKDIFVSHSFSVLQLEEHFTIFYRNEFKNIDNCGHIVKISANDDNVVMVNHLGKLLKSRLAENFDIIHEIPNILHGDIPDEKIIDITCGSKLCVAYTNKGRLFNVPNKLSFENLDIVDVKCGKEHCIMLDKLGNVYSFGRGSRGQLGHGSLDDMTEPKPVEALGGIKIVKIAVGGWHSCAVSKDGDLYTWGWNSNDNSHLYGSGWNRYKQLLNEDKENFYEFVFLHDYSAEKIVHLKCGSWNSILICA